MKYTCKYKNCVKSFSNLKSYSKHNLNHIKKIKAAKMLMSLKNKSHVKDFKTDKQIAVSQLLKMRNWKPTFSSKKSEGSLVKGGGLVKVLLKSKTLASLVPDSVKINEVYKETKKSIPFVTKEMVKNIYLEKKYGISNPDLPIKSIFGTTTSVTGEKKSSKKGGIFILNPVEAIKFKIALDKIRKTFPEMTSDKLYEILQVMKEEKKTREQLATQIPESIIDELATVSPAKR